jgi:GAF domain-containing protein
VPRSRQLAPAASWGRPGPGGPLGARPGDVDLATAATASAGGAGSELAGRPLAAGPGVLKAWCAAGPRGGRGLVRDGGRGPVGGRARPAPPGPALRELVAKLGIRSLALVPLLSRGRFLGLLALCWTERHPLDREQEALLGLAGNQIAGALEAALRLEEAERAAGEARAVFYAIADGVLLSDPSRY